MKRSLSDSMYDYCLDLNYGKFKKLNIKNPIFLDNISSTKFIQARVYQADDYLKPD